MARDIPGRSRKHNKRLQRLEIEKLFSGRRENLGPVPGLSPHCWAIGLRDIRIGRVKVVRTGEKLVEALQAKPVATIRIAG